MEHLTKFILLYKRDYGKTDTLNTKVSRILDITSTSSTYKIAEKDNFIPNLQNMFNLAFLISTHFIDSLSILKIPENSFSKAPNNIDSDNDVDEIDKKPNFILPLSLSENLIEILSSLFEISSKDTTI